MKKLINGSVYDTEKAELVYEFSQNKPTDADYIHESLYCTEKRNLFIHGVGGPKTKYVVYAGDDKYIGGEDIIPISSIEGFLWIARYAEANFIDVTLKAFPECFAKA